MVREHILYGISPFKLLKLILWQSVGKGTLMSNLSNFTQSYKNGLWAWNTSLPRNGVYTACASLIILCGNIFPCFRLTEALLSLLGACESCGTWPTPLLCLSFVKKGKGLSILLWYKRGAHRHIALQQPLVETHWPWGTDAQHWSWACSVFSLRKYNVVPACLTALCSWQLWCQDAMGRSI